MDVGKKIKDYLDEKGISQSFISNKTGIGTVKLNLALNGNRRLTIEEYVAICKALELDTNTFLQ